MGISSIANVLMAIKMAKWYELGDNDVILTVWTDSMELYESRLREMHEEHGEYTETDAAVDYHEHLLGLHTDNMEELTYLGSQARPQPQVLHLGRAAGQDLRGNPGAMVRPGLLGQLPEPNP